MKGAVSCGGVVVYKGKILLLNKNYNNRYYGWVLPKGTMETGESMEETALREVKEESGAECRIISYIGDTKFDFVSNEGLINKTVHWFLMKASSYSSRPQGEEGFVDSGYFDYDNAINKLRFDNERNIVIKGYEMYKEAQKDKN